MRSLILLTLCAVLVASVAMAAPTANVQLRTVPLGGETALSLSFETAGVAPLQEESQQIPAFSELQAAVTLNCQNDNTIDLGNTLVIGPGDLAGVVFSVPAQPKPWLLREASFGLVDYGQTYPATLEFDIYEDDLAGSFQFVVGFTVDVDVSPGLGDVVTVDISSFAITGSNDILTLYGDAAPSPGGYMLPTGDASPRCMNEAGTNYCAVHVPAGSGTLYLYGVVDATTCFRTSHNILLFDLVHEIVIDEIPIATERRSWGAVKSRF
jgi:hypothetical protein